jgi:hypothetical protein
VAGFFCDGSPHLGLVLLGGGFRGEGFHVALAVLIAPVGIIASELCSHGDLWETVLLLGAWMLGFLAVNIYRVYP